MNDRKTENRIAFREGMRDGIPIALGYFAVSFTLGIAARNAGLNPFQGFLTSILCNASAGEYAGFTVIAADAPYIEMVIVILVANARYLLMSSALSQRISPETKPIHRFIISFDIVDEIFGIAIARPGYLNPFYYYGAMFLAMPCWSVGTALGVLAGNILPMRVVSALSVALYGMFLAIIIPPSKKDKVVACLVVISFISSYIFTKLPYVRDISGGTRTIILTVIIAGLASVLFPVKEVQNEA
ncbi:MAG: AzlC family ABC transporter permease [Clostridia bacterium]|nr:AzlC family ABC transporter permease [Clostridia bacterium]